jgi:hypothetical protein
LITSITFGKGYILWSFWVCSFLQLPVTYSFLAKISSLASSGTAHKLPYNKVLWQYLTVSSQFL